MKKTTLFVLLLSMAFSTSSFVQTQSKSFSCNNVLEIPNAECLALQDLYNYTNGNEWKNNTNWLLTNTPSNWFGVTVQYGSVFSIDLLANQLEGTIPPSIGDLLKMEILNLRGNQLSGSLPPSFGNLTKLENLYLSQNKLTGEIPSTFGNMSYLMDLYLDNNQISGSIPFELGNLNRLWHLDLSWNELTGSIPPQLGNLRVWLFDLSSNQLEGSIPPELGTLINTTELNLYGNQLSGEIPAELGNISSLQKLFLDFNQLEGHIPPQLGNLSNLRGLYLYMNNLSGPIPPELGSLSNLEYLQIGNNQLTGPLPEELGNLSKLFSFDLTRNPINSTLPSFIGNLVNLRHLYMAYCQLSGPIPAEIGNLVNLEELSLASNQFQGEIPIEITNLINLNYLFLGYNFLTVPAQEPVASFLELKQPDWYKTQAIEQEVDNSNETTITSHDGLTTIKIYPESLPSEAIFTFIPQEEPSQNTGGLTFANNSFLLNAVDSLGVGLTIFEIPLIVEISYDEAYLEGFSEQSLALYYWNLDENTWMDVVTTCENGDYQRNFEKDKLSVKLCHLSEFSLLSGPLSFQSIFLPLITR